MEVNDVSYYHEFDMLGHFPNFLNHPQVRPGGLGRLPYDLLVQCHLDLFVGSTGSFLIFSDFTDFMGPVGSAK